MRCCPVVADGEAFSDYNWPFSQAAVVGEGKLICGPYGEVLGTVGVRVTPIWDSTPALAFKSGSAAPELRVTTTAYTFFFGPLDFVCGLVEAKGITHTPLTVAFQNYDQRLVCA